MLVGRNSITISQLDGINDNYDNVSILCDKVYMMLNLPKTLEFFSDSWFFNGKRMLRKKITTYLLRKVKYMM